jgi:hypothetical protein
VTPLRGTVRDDDWVGAAIVVDWTSSIDGELGSSEPDTSGAVHLTAELSLGTHRIGMRCTDGDGLTGQDERMVYVDP